MQNNSSPPFTPSPALSPAAAVFGVFALALLLNLFFATAYEIPVPDAHDEFSYLLGADTFASGRLTNPTPPQPEFFASYHIFHTPTYQSKYPPAQAAFLALGQVLSGEPAAGVWLSFALACAATVWMLLPLMPAGWAAVAGMLPLFSPMLFTNWGQSYWGGAVAWFASALLLGGLLRWWRGAGVKPAGIAGIGLFILGNARPFEGALLVAMLGIVGVIFFWKEFEPTIRFHRLKQAWPLLAAVFFLLLWTGYYNARLTGDPWLFPHTHFAQVQAETPAIAWKANPVPRDRAAGWLLTHFLLWWPVLALPAGLLKIKQRRSSLALTLMGTAVAVAVFTTTASHPHYYAPLLPLWLALLGVSLWELSKKQGFGRKAAGGLFIVQAVTWALFIVGQVWQGPPNDWAHQRQQLVDGLQAQGDERYLVMVKTAPTWPGHHELVYNPADLENAKVIFARDFGPEKNQDLFKAYPNRTIWPLAVGFSENKSKAHSDQQNN